MRSQKSTVRCRRSACHISGAICWTTGDEPPDRASLGSACKAEIATSSLRLSPTELYADFLQILGRQMWEDLHCNVVVSERLDIVRELQFAEPSPNICQASESCWGNCSLSLGPNKVFRGIGLPEQGPGKTGVVDNGPPDARSPRRQESP